MKQPLVWRIAYLAATFIVLTVSVGASAQLATKKSGDSGVTVAVTPVSLDANGMWQFRVVLDTHSQDLSDDLAKDAILVDDQGRESRPVAWEGAAPGGHHREGMLKFPALEPLPASIELRIMRSGEAAPRIFGWKLK